jgi:hypothetical protein
MSLTITAEKPLFNIGRIPVRQSGSRVLPEANGQILPPGRKKASPRGSVVERMRGQAIEIKGYFLGPGMARSLLTIAEMEDREAACV